MEQNIVIIGAGQAGLSAATKLRQLGLAGQINMVGSEIDPPYGRPPLSKKYLMGQLARERLYLRPQSFYAEHDINWLPETTATRINRDTKQVELTEGSLTYDHLILTTGATPSGSHHLNCHIVISFNF